MGREGGWAYVIGYFYFHRSVLPERRTYVWEGN